MGSVEVLWDGDGIPLSGKDMGSVEVLWDGDWVTPLCGQTDISKYKHELLSYYVRG